MSAPVLAGLDERRRQALDALLDVREPRAGLSAEFMLGWSVTAALVASGGVSQQAAERFVRKEHLTLARFGAEHGEYLRGMRAAIQAVRS